MAKAHNEFILGPAERAPSNAAGVPHAAGDVRRMVAAFLAAREGSDDPASAASRERAANEPSWLRSFIDGPEAPNGWRARFEGVAPSPSMLMAFAAAPVAFLGVALFAAVVLDPVPAAPSGQGPVATTAAVANAYPRQRLAIEEKAADRQSVSSRTAALAADRASLSGSPEAIVLPEGARMGAIALDGDRLAVHVEGPDGAFVMVYDATEGRVVAEIPIVDAPRKGGARNNP